MVDNIQSAFNTIKNNSTNKIVGTNIVDVSRTYINDLNTLLDLLRTGSLYYSTDIIDGSKGWNPVPNTITPFKGLGHADAPVSANLGGGTSGIVVSVSNTSTFNYVVMDNGYMAIKTTIWHYYEPTENLKADITKQLNNTVANLIPAVGNSLVNSELHEGIDYLAKWRVWGNVTGTRVVGGAPDKSGIPEYVNVINLNVPSPIANSEFGIAQDGVPVTVGETYTASILYMIPIGKNSHHVTLQFGGQDEPYYKTITGSLVGDGKWHRLSLSHVITKGDNINVYMGMSNVASNGGSAVETGEFTAMIALPMFSRGSQPTAWLPNLQRKTVTTLVDNVDLNTVKTAGDYFVATTSAVNGAPLTGWGWLSVQSVIAGATGSGPTRIKQIWYPDEGTGIAYRVTSIADSNQWQNWKVYNDNGSTVNTTGDQAISGSKHFTGIVNADSFTIGGRFIPTYNSTLTNGNILSGYDAIHIGGNKADNTASARYVRFYSKNKTTADAHIQVDPNTTGAEFGSNMNIVAREINIINKNGGRGLINGVEIANKGDINATRTFATTEDAKVIDQLTKSNTELNKQIADLKAQVKSKEGAIAVSPWMNLTTRNGFSGFIHYRTVTYSGGQTMISISGVIGNINGHVPNYICDFPLSLKPSREIPLLAQQPKNNDFTKIGISVGGKSTSIRLNFTAGTSSNNIEISGTYWVDVV